MNPEFSLDYGGIPFHSADHLPTVTESGAEYRLDDGVTVTVKATEYPEFDAVWWALFFQNRSSEDSKILSNIRDCDLLLPLAEQPYPTWDFRLRDGQSHVITMNGMVDGLLYVADDQASATEYGQHTDFLNRPRHYENFGGRSSDGMMPFFRVEADGAGAVVAVGWTGDWRADFRREEGGVRIQTGLKTASFYLKSGETVRTSSVLIMRYSEADRAGNQFRRFVSRHVSPFRGEKTERNLLAFELWGELPSEEMIRRIGQLKEYGVAFEQIWIDAGWYGHQTGAKNNWNKHTGDWTPNEVIHRDRMDDVAAKIKQCGMGMMLWVEPERAYEETPIVKERPEWFLRCEENGKTSPFALINLGNREAWQAVFDTVCGLIERYDLKCYRQDFNVPPCEYFSQNDEENRKGMLEIQHIMGLYRLWDALLARYPGLMIDNCSSGGRRIDVETLKRAYPFFRSDYQCQFDSNPEVLQVHNANVSCLIPFSGCTNKVKSDTYAIRSSYSAGWGGAFYNRNFQSMTPEDFDWARKTVEEYRRIRGYFSKDYYNHGSLAFDQSAWAIWQYHDAEAKKGIVMAFRREKSPFRTAEILLRGVPEDAKIRFVNREAKTEWVGGPAVSLTLNEPRSSMILEYEAET